MRPGAARWTPVMVALIAGLLILPSSASLAAGGRLAISPPVPEGSETAAAASPQVRRPAAQPTINPDGPTSARVCGQCHTDIYNSWRNSLHAFALSDPIFDAAFMQAVKVGGETARRTCLSCHAPLTTVNGDYELREAVTTEGISCDFCHSVTAAHVDGRAQPYDLQPGAVKRSVLRQAESPAHEVAYSELHATSEFCGGCHSYESPEGAAVMTTYREWQQGPYASEGVQCQNCHMVLSTGNTVNHEDPEPGGEIHLHSLIHDRDQLRSALAVDISQAVRRGDRLEVEVTVENVGSAHMVPTGVPTREVVLSVVASSGSRNQVQERRYRKVVGDARGRPLETDYEAMLFGAQIMNDNRIGPREKRTERFSFFLPAADVVKLEATASYYYAPVVVNVREMNIQLAYAERYVR